MPDTDLVIRGKRVVLSQTGAPSSFISSKPTNETRFAIVPASIHVRKGVIAAIGGYDEVPLGCKVIDAAPDSIVMPGLVDSHVHINEPGRTDWEGFATATRAAAAGGVTTIIDMPLNSVPATTTLEGFRTKLNAAQGKCCVDVGFWGGVVPGNTAEIAPLFGAGVVGFKCFLIHSGVDEFPQVTEEDLRKAMPELARLEALLIVHAELPGPINRAGIIAQDAALPSGQNVSATKYSTFLRSRPRASENEAVELMIRLAREFDARIHIVHHSSADALPMLREAKAAGVRITAETCPHYLYFQAEKIPDGATEFKCCPPIREHENRELLWRALADGAVDMVVSDHSPCPPAMKLLESGDFLQAWGGISSLQLRLPVTWTEARRRGHSIEDLTEWLCCAPAKLVGLERRKGAIAAGLDADIVIWEPEREFRVDQQMIQHRHKLSPYEGEVLQGTVEKTFLRGKLIYDDGRFVSETEGTLLANQTAEKEV